jgi:uncharacterized 2Fe-2S/4Fe-4S cluster protein (DUF4445 family)
MVSEVRLETTCTVFPAEPSVSILTAALEAGLPLLVSSCGGRGNCGQCRIKIISGTVSPPSEDEISRLGERALKDGVRLACRTRALSDLTISIPPQSRSAIGRSLIETSSHIPPMTGDRPAPTGTTGGSPGIAIDLGTTNITAQLVDSASGVTLARQWTPNPQQRYGDDVMSRLTFARDDGAAKLKEVLLEALNRLLTALAGEAAVSQVCIAGNTVMHHLLLGLPVRQMGIAPYTPHTRRGVTKSAVEIGLSSVPRASVYLMPNIAGFVGGDHVAALLATGLSIARGSILLLDIGTNTEVSLSVNGDIRSTSCASGPAFEGGAIEHGMPATEGAIESVLMENDNLTLGVIGGVKPRGICGSGILDAIHQMRLHAAIDDRGRLKPHPRTRPGRRGLEFVLAASPATGTGSDIVITQADISQLQLAKAAIRTGIDALLADAGMTPNQLDQVIVAGGFGSFLKVASAVGIGMLPPVSENRISQVGNAAVVGAKLALLAGNERESLESLAAGVKHVDLASLAGFKGYYARALSLRPDRRGNS